MGRVVKRIVFDMPFDGDEYEFEDAMQTICEELCDVDEDDPRLTVEYKDG